MSQRHPEVQWAQSRNDVFLKVMIDSPTNVQVEIQENKIKVSGHSPAGEYSVELELFDEVTQDKSKWLAHPRLVELSLHKKDSKWWSRLLKAEGKAPHYIKVDWSRWKDEDDSDGAPDNFNFEADPSEFEDEDE